MASRFVILFILLGFFTFSAFEAEPEYGLLRGTAKFEDGSPYSALPVMVKMGDIITKLITQDDGNFSGLALVGEVTVSGPGVSVTVTVTAGETSLVSLVVKHLGVLLKSDAPKIASDDQIEIVVTEWVSRDGKVNELKSPTETGKTWYPEVPPDAGAFIVKLWWQKLNMQFVTTYTWQFAHPNTERLLCLPLAEKVTSPGVTVTDENGKPYSNASMAGTLRWAQDGPNPAIVECQFTGYRTTSTGQLSLPQYWLPGKYHLTLTAQGKTGAEIEMQYGKDGKLKPETYLLKRNQG